MPVIELPDGRVVEINDADMPAFEQAMAAEFAAAQPAPPPSPTEFLPQELNIAGFETGVPISEDVSKFLVGAGRTFDQIGTGLKQLVSSGEVNEELQAAEAADRETFAALDDLGIGFEDLGQAAPELLASLIPGLGVARLAKTPLQAAGAMVGGGAALGAGIEGVKAEAAEGEREQNMLAGAIGGGIGAGVAGAISKRFITALAGLGGTQKAAGRRRLLNIFDRSAKAGTLEQEARAIREAGGETLGAAQRAARQKAIQANREQADKLYREEILPMVQTLSQRDKLDLVNSVGRTFRDSLPDALQSPTPMKALQDVWAQTFEPMSRAEINREFKTHGKAITAVGNAIVDRADRFTAEEIETAVAAATGEMGQKTVKAIESIANQPVSVVKQVLAILAGQQAGAASSGAQDIDIDRIKREAGAEVAEQVIELTR